MDRWMRAVGAVMLAMGLVVAAPRAADAALVQMTFTAAGVWELAPNTGPPPSAPYGMSTNPTLIGTALLDNSLAGEAAFIAFSVTTGSRTWTLADDIVFAEVKFSADGLVSDFFIVFDGLVLGGESGASFGSTFSVGEGVVTLSCNSCLTLESSRVVTPVPAPAALALFGMGLIGLGAARRFARRAP